MTRRLTVDRLAVDFNVDGRLVNVLRDVSFTLDSGKTLAIVGESGSGKSVMSLALMRLLAKPPRAFIHGSVKLHGTDTVEITDLPERHIQKLRGSRMAMIFQEPLTALNPVMRIGTQIVEAIRSHEKVSVDIARREALELLEQVGIAEPERRLKAFPHELSGGMRQRVMIAIAISQKPDILIADEPTTALDVTVQAQILELLKDLQRKTNMAMIFVTHNFGVVAEIADNVMVMYAGGVVETGSADAVLSRPLMPYTAGLMNAIPRLADAGLPEPALKAIDGYVPDARHLPSGCTFNPRCEYRLETLCDAEVPAMEEAGDNHMLRCHRWRELEFRTS